jgi:hypothetical protein
MLSSLNVKTAKESVNVSKFPRGAMESLRAGLGLPVRLRHVYACDGQRATLKARCATKPVYYTSKQQ